MLKEILLSALSLAVLTATHIPNVNRFFNSALELEMRGVSETIHRSLNKAGIDSVDIGIFSPKSKDPGQAHYGRRIQEALRSELGLVGLQIRSNSPARISGDFRFDTNTGEILISTELTDRLGNPLQNVDTGPIPATILDNQEIVMIANVSAPLKPQIRRNELTELAKQSLEQTLLPPKIEKTIGENNALVKVPGLDIGIRLMKVNPHFVPGTEGYFLEYINPSVSAELSSHPVFPIKENEHFAIELVNTGAKMHVAAEVFLDGISSFALSEITKTDASGKKIPVHQHWAVLKNSQTQIPGWFKNLKEMSAFQVVPDKNSVAARLGQTDGLGTIQVLVRAAWEKGTTPPAEAFRAPITRGSKGIGEGPIVNALSKEIALETGVLIGAITVRYEAD